MSEQSAMKFMDFDAEEATAHDVFPLAIRAAEIVGLLSGDTATDELRAEHDELLARIRAWNQAHQIFPMTAGEFPDFGLRDLGEMQ